MTLVSSWLTSAQNSKGTRCFSAVAELLVVLGQVGMCRHKVHVIAHVTS